MLDNKYAFSTTEKINGAFYMHVIDTGGQETYCGMNKVDIPNRRYTTYTNIAGSDIKYLLCPVCQIENKNRHSAAYNIKGWK